MKRKILIVDDNRSLLDSLLELLERQGFAAEPADDVRVARRLYERERPDVMLLDCDIRGHDGLSWFDELRAEPPVAPVIVMTARQDAQTVLRCRELGAESLLNKPFRMESLISEVERILLTRAVLSPEELARPLRLLAHELPKLIAGDVLLRYLLEERKKEEKEDEDDDNC